VTVSVLQHRDDYGPRRLQIAVDNAGTSELTVTGAAFVSDRFAQRATWTGDTAVPAGTTRDLPVSLTASECEAEPGAAVRIELAYALPDGSTGKATVVPTDPFGAIDKIVGEDCIEQRTAEIATVTLGRALRTTTIDGELVAELDVAIAPTGADGQVTIDSVDRTILLRPRQGDGWPVGETVTASTAPRVVTLEIVPANCRFHTVTEDKRGTFFPLRVTDRQGAPGLFYLPASDAVKAEVYRYIADYCGW
jgi:hypothetical protein